MCSQVSREQKTTYKDNYPLKMYKVHILGNDGKRTKLDFG
jgi:hypothetical protein